MPHHHLRISGHNLMWDQAPHVTINGTAAPVIEARPERSSVEPPDDASGGRSLRTAPHLEMALSI